MKNQLEQILSRFERLTESMADEATLSDPQKLQNAARERSEMEPIAGLARKLQDVYAQIDDDREVVAADEDAELVELARSELEELEPRRADMERRLRIMLVPRDPSDSKNTIVEIRAGTGGDEASLFAGDLYRMYTRFAESKGWKHEQLSKNETGTGGLKEVIFLVQGKDAYGTLKYESGVHRVQRVPVTESSGRIHTSAASVAVLPEAEDVDVHIDPNELKIDVYRSSGPGGQSVNTTDSAVRVTHIPTGLVVTCQDEKSQHKNKDKALKVLRARLLETAQHERDEKLSQERRTQIGSGDRSAKIRTYNFPQQRVTDHRINLTLHRLEEILAGELDEVVKALREADVLAQIKA